MPESEVVSLLLSRLLGEDKCLLNRFVSNVDRATSDVMLWGRCFLRTLPEDTWVGSVWSAKQALESCGLVNRPLVTPAGCQFLFSYQLPLFVFFMMRGVGVGGGGFPK